MIVTAILIAFTGRVFVDPLLLGFITDMTSVTGGSRVHQVHIWSLSSDIHVLDAHIYFCERHVTKIADLKWEIKERLENYHIYHSTLEVECEECADCVIVEPVNGQTE